MGSRKRHTAEARKEANKTQYFAKLNNCPTSPRKMRLVVGMVRGMEAEKALYILKHAPQEASIRVRKLLLSAISNWQQKNEGVRMDSVTLYIKEIMVDSGRTLKRMRPAPRGMGHRILKRSNHVTLILGNKVDEKVDESNIK